MFVNQSRLVHRLAPRQYTDDGQYQREMASLFQPGWHLVGTVHDVPRSGAYMTTTLLGTPVLLRNFDDEVHAFLNVCVHRHALLSSARRGRSWAMACQYHGWEYKKDGRTARIPDARGFRPWDRKHVCLKKFRVERCGELLFVCLEQGGPGLREHLGPLWKTWEEGFDGRCFRLASAWEYECACNWKVATENSLESYHTPTVHPWTFRQYAPESDCEHALDERYTSFTTPVPVSWVRRAQGVLLGVLGMPNRNRYEHHLVHPNLQLSTHDTLRLAMVVEPKSPTTCTFRSWMYTAHGKRWGPHVWLSRWIIQSFAVAFARQVQREDARIFPAIQAGLGASPYPGMLSPREERIFEFQRYVSERTGSTEKAVGFGVTSRSS